MKTTVSLFDFRDAFRQCGRESQFSYDALGLLFDHFEQIEDDTGMVIELDVIAICCEYSEDSIEDIALNYSIDVTDADDMAETVEDWLADRTMIAGKTDDGKIVYQQF